MQAEPRYRRQRQNKADAGMGGHCTARDKTECARVNECGSSGDKLRVLWTTPLRKATRMQQWGEQDGEVDSRGLGEEEDEERAADKKKDVSLLSNFPVRRCRIKCEPRLPGHSRKIGKVRAKDNARQRSAEEQRTREHEGRGAGWNCRENEHDV